MFSNLSLEISLTSNFILKKMDNSINIQNTDASFKFPDIYNVVTQQTKVKTSNIIVLSEIKSVHRKYQSLDTDNQLFDSVKQCPLIKSNLIEDNIPLLSPVLKHLKIFNHALDESHKKYSKENFLDEKIRNIKNNYFNPETKLQNSLIINIC